eukprot:TRINITY_DN14928_c0_g1_i1.p1 TRINITY_DN14928_c0_g1~~TRINITY_DN14928_c0_g1_i1.p1  ORF type:complete len:469 (-),score=65.50 TRINITY_DN14928_c0_g1_i1:148-1554(-)
MPNIRAAVIGAGAAGLCAGKLLREAGLEVTVFEKAPTVGGTWVLDHGEGSFHSCFSSAPPHDFEHVLLDPSSHSSMYNCLVTNLPKQAMAFSDMEFPAELPSFLGHEQVQAYLASFADNFDLLSLVRFSTCVTSIEQTASSPDKWIVTYETHSNSNVDENSVQSLNSAHTDTFDFVAVCNGHYTRPAADDGLQRILADFGGSVAHSHGYRSPEQFVNRRVVIVGSGPSGIDISQDLRDAGASVFRSVRGSEITEATPERVVILQNGDVLRDIDLVLLCTGYEYTFPPIRMAGGECPFSVTPDKRRVNGLWKQFIAISHPSIALVGLPFRCIPFPMFEIQLALLAQAWSGLISLPTSGVMLDDVKRRELDLEARGVEERHWHALGIPHFKNYYEDLYAMLDTESPSGASYQRLDRPVIFEIFQYIYAKRRKLREGGAQSNAYRHLEFTLSTGGGWSCAGPDFVAEREAT